VLNSESALAYSKTSALPTGSRGGGNAHTVSRCGGGSDFRLVSLGLSAGLSEKIKIESVEKRGNIGNPCLMGTRCVFGKLRSGASPFAEGSTL